VRLPQHASSSCDKARLSKVFPPRDNCSTLPAIVRRRAAEQYERLFYDVASELALPKATPAQSTGKSARTCIATPRKPDVD
jgi:hypothetical protein